MKKKNKYMAKRKEWLVKLHAPIRSSLFFHPGSTAVLLSHYVPASIFYSRYPAVLLSCCLPTLISRSRSPSVLFSRCMPTSFSNLDLLLFCHLVVCLLWLDLQLFLCLVMFLFLVAEFQLFYCYF